MAATARRMAEQRLSTASSTLTVSNVASKSTVKTPSPSSSSNTSSTKLKTPTSEASSNSNSNSKTKHGDDDLLNISGAKEILDESQVVIMESPASTNNSPQQEQQQEPVEAIYDENKKEELNETSAKIAIKTLSFSNSTLNLQNVMMEDENEEVANSTNKVRRSTSTGSTATAEDSLKLDTEEFESTTSTSHSLDTNKLKGSEQQEEIQQVPKITVEETQCAAEVSKKPVSTVYSNGSYEAEDCVPMLQINDSEVDHYYYRHFSKPKFFKRQFTLEEVPEINFLNLKNQGDWFGQMLRTLLRDLKNEIENPLSFALALAALYYRQAFFHVWNKACREENNEIVHQLRTDYMYHLQYSYEILSNIKEITRAAMIAVRLYT